MSPFALEIYMYVKSLLSAHALLQGGLTGRHGDLKEENNGQSEHGKC